MAWFEASTPVLNQLGATIGRGVSQQGGSGAPDYSELFDNMIAEQQRQADRAYELERTKVDQDYQTARQNAKTARERLEIDRWYNREQVRIAGKRLDEERRQFDLSHGMNQAKLGMDVLGLQAQLRGPSDYFAASNLARGVAAQSGSAAFLNALRDNTQLAGFGAQAGAPDAVSVNGLMAKMGGPAIMPGTGGGEGGGADATDALHRQIQQIGAQGAHRLGAGSLEQLTDTELQLLLGGLETPGPDGKAFDAKTFMDQYRRSRVGNSGSFQAA